MPVLPMELFAGASDESYEAGDLLGDERDTGGGGRARVDATDGSPVAGVSIRKRVLLSTRFEMPALARGAYSDVRAVLATCPEWDPELPGSLARFRWLFF